MDKYKLHRSPRNSEVTADPVEQLPSEIDISADVSNNMFPGLPTT